jgi:holliday junction DNA helicase RuvA
MIARLQGRLAARRADGIVVDVGGVGYLVHASSSVLRGAEPGGEVAVETHLHVRDDALQLYGFADAEERELFAQLLAVSGVGPKVALAIVSGSPTAELRRAIALEDTARFQAIPGIGKKTAQRVVLELKEKLDLDADAARPRQVDAGDVFVRDALVNLGYSVAEAEAALAQVDPELPPEERVRLALKRAA